MKKSHTLTAVLFLAVLFGLLFYTVADYSSIVSDVKTAYQDGGPEKGTAFDKLLSVTENTDDALHNSLDRSNLFIQLYGGFQRLLGKTFIPDTLEYYTVTKLDDGFLTFTNPSGVQLDTADNANALADLAETLGDVPLLYLQAPQKVSAVNSGLAPGLKDYGNAQADQFLSVLQQRGVDTLDFRPVFEATGDYHSYFFRTDHHWNPAGAFLAFQTLCDTLRTTYGLTIDSSVDDAASYTVETLPDFFLGSQGKRVGTLYAGTDDFELWTPAFSTALTFFIPDWGFSRTGSYTETVVFPERVAQRDYFGGNPYTYYGGGDYPLTKIVNENNPDGPVILLLRDSFGCAITPFLSLACSELDLIDLRYYEGDVADYVSELSPDIVLVLNSPSATAKSVFFTF